MRQWRRPDHHIPCRRPHHESRTFLRADCGRPALRAPGRRAGAASGHRLGAQRSERDDHARRPPQRTRLGAGRVGADPVQARQRHSRQRLQVRGRCRAVGFYRRHAQVPDQGRLPLSGRATARQVNRRRERLQPFRRPADDAHGPQQPEPSGPAAGAVLRVVGPERPRPGRRGRAPHIHFGQHRHQVRGQRLRRALAGADRQLGRWR
jgi:hypothetical protein